MGVLLSVSGCLGSPSIWRQALWATIIISFGLEASDLITAALVGPCEIPRLSKLERMPRVAILYLVCDDLVPTALARLGKSSYQNLDIFVLDDSQQNEYGKQLNRAEFKVLRRASRSGNKAGSLNNWLRLYGTRYEYFLVFDSDSIANPGFLEEILH
jgi:hypothetical protein